MKYKDLIQFEPLERVVQLIDSKEKQIAQNLVSSYVISETMAERLIHIVFEQLQFDNPHDNMGLFIVGNYGTGKSHLMSVISAIASDADMVRFVNNNKVADSASKIAGQFKVIRVEIGAVKTSFRDIVVHELEDFLASEGIQFSIPAADAITNNKGWLEDMMAAFNAKYPDSGLLFVMDELLDYLRTKTGMELASDFGFMRELGEVCKNLRFRFIAGLQEALFDNERFAFASDSLRRVHERFEQVDIARNDVKYVVSERLLRKTLDQQRIIRTHLEKVAPFYGDMAARMDEYVKMFPVHPDYIDVFERIIAVEKRMILRTLSDEMNDLLDKEVPEDAPGIIAYDSYWKKLTGNPAYRTISDIRQILDCTSILIQKIKSLRRSDQQLAERIINGLAVNRLTTGGINNPVGITTEEMRDSLCLYDPLVKELGGDPADDMKTRIESIMSKIREAVSGQFITRNESNQQYYIDVQRIVDYDAKIQARAQMLDNDKFDYAYFDALKIMMEVQDVPTKVTGYNIWEYDKIIWADRQAPRCGYLFFGAPNERSTAQPPRDYYIYFLRHFDPVRFQDNKKADEVFFKLDGADDTLINAIRNYAGALDLAAISSAGADKNAYLQKAKYFLGIIVKWLQEKNTSAFKITYQGQSKTLANWLQGANLRQLSGIGNNQTLNFRDMINTISAFLMKQYFQDSAPDYPKFRDSIAIQARPQAVADALRVISGGHTRQGAIVLDALNLLDGDHISTSNSKYAKRVLAAFQNHGAGQVVNHDELVQYDRGSLYFDLNASRLEVEYLVVVLAALVSTGEITLSVLGEKFDATSLNRLASKSLDDLVAFQHIEQPKDWNLPGLKALFDLLGLPQGYPTMVTQGKDAPVQEMQIKIGTLVDQIVHIQSFILNGLTFFGVDLLSICNFQDAANELSRAKDFLEYMQNFNSTSKLKQLKKDQDEIASFGKAVSMIEVLEKLRNFVMDEKPVENYIQTATTVLLPGDAWIEKEQEVRRTIRERLNNARNAKDIVAILPRISEELRALKREYITSYMKLHKDARLNAADEVKCGKLRNDKRLKTLQELSVIDLMPRQKLNDLKNRLNELRSCNSLTEMSLQQNNTVCPNCMFYPSREHAHGKASDILRSIDNQLDEMLEDWTQIILTNLEDPVTQGHMELLQADDQAAIQQFLETRSLDNPINPALISALKQVFEGLIKIVVSKQDLESALQNGGPAKVDELKQRFAEHVDNLVRGKDPNKIRIVLE